MRRRGGDGSRECIVSYHPDRVRICGRPRPGNGNEPISYYRDARHFRLKRPGGERVDEIDVLSKRATISPPGQGVPADREARAGALLHPVAIPGSAVTSVRPRAVGGNQILLEPSDVLVDGPP